MSGFIVGVIVHISASTYTRGNPAPIHSASVELLCDYNAGKIIVDFKNVHLDDLLEQVNAFVKVCASGNISHIGQEASQ